MAQLRYDHNWEKTKNLYFSNCVYNIFRLLEEPLRYNGGGKMACPNDQNPTKDTTLDFAAPKFINPLESAVRQILSAFALGPTKRESRSDEAARNATLNPIEVVPDHILRKLAAGDAARQRGEISEEDTAILTMVLPDICGELLAYRFAARRGV